MCIDSLYSLKSIKCIIHTNYALERTKHEQLQFTQIFFNNTKNENYLFASTFSTIIYFILLSLWITLKVNYRANITQFSTIRPKRLQLNQYRASELSVCFVSAPTTRPIWREGELRIPGLFTPKKCGFFLQRAWKIIKFIRTLILDNRSPRSIITNSLDWRSDKTLSENWNLKDNDFPRQSRCRVIVYLFHWVWKRLSIEYRVVKKKSHL